MPEKKKISILGLVATILVTLSVGAMFLPLVSVSMFGATYSVSIFDTVIEAFGSLTEFEAICYVAMAVLTLASLAFAVLSMFKSKLTIGTVASSFTAVACLILPLVINNDLDELFRFLGLGSYAYVALMLGATVVSVIAFCQKPKPVAVVEPMEFAPFGTPAAKPEEPAMAPFGAPVEKPVVSATPVAAPVEKPVAPATPVAVPVEKPVTPVAPVAAPVEKPVAPAAPVAAPVEAPVAPATPVAVPVEKPVAPATPVESPAAPVRSRIPVVPGVAPGSVPPSPPVPPVAPPPPVRPMPGAPELSSGYTAPASVRTVTCAGCRSTIDAGMRFCPNCGTPTSAPPPRPAPAPVRKPYCPSCRVEMEPGMRFCRYCGSPVHTVAVPGATAGAGRRTVVSSGVSAPVAKGARTAVCPHCGARQLPGMPNCKYCGTRMW